VGDSNGHVGLGVKCAKEVSSSSEAAVKMMRPGWRRDADSQRQQRKAAAVPQQRQQQAHAMGCGQQHSSDWLTC
jgi:hypothetical protein